MGDLLVTPDLLTGGVEAHLILFWSLLAFGVVPSFTLPAGPNIGPGVFDVVPFNFTSFVSVSAPAITTICDGLVLAAGGVLENVFEALGAMDGSSVLWRERSTRREMPDHTRLKDNDVHLRSKGPKRNKIDSETAPAGQEHVEQSQHTDA